MQTTAYAFAALILAGGGTVSAASLDARPADAPIVLAANGCGPGFFRTITGECFRNRRMGIGPGGRVIAPPPCPRGYRRDPDPARPLCYPLF